MTPPSEQRELLALARRASVARDVEFTTSPFVAEVARFAAEAGQPACREKLREVLAQLIEAGEPEIDELAYPHGVRELIRKQFARIRAELLEKEDEYFDVGDFRFRSDCRIACFGRVPVGPQHLEIDGLPGSLLYRGGLGQSWRLLGTALASRGRRPYYALHLANDIWPPAFQLVYSAEAQLKMFHRLAGCLAMNPHVRGVLSCGWLFDPQLDKVSPALAYLRRGWIDNGGRLFYWGRSDDSDRMATKNSRPRQQRFQEGVYRPAEYLVAFPRKRLLAWARAHPEYADSGDAPTAPVARAEGFAEDVPAG
ncbi:MAG: hypothetical protein DWQ31_11455 [Planctomycetota bacterium]|nr:MAG: hypothetical protein DWQ31_11455 [Planctomycetota bacterium]REJ97834.1 MAG: hypothetical protein DWQ35_01265 [Planctomycetota bacterium]REK22900.1 MAG: hypothetical protein DWQ42_16450 [Planctomycetota bacterium]REK37400.1 MAG: hypothetical protein DWQ46_22225 [Planctomycetota bacterium]